MKNNRMELNGIGVLQMRAEDHLYVAYLSPEVGDFDGGIQIGSISARVLHGNEELLQQFVKLMHDTITAIVEGATNGRVTVKHTEAMTEAEAREIVGNPGKLDAMREKLVESSEESRTPTDVQADLNAAFDRFRAGRRSN